MEDILFLDRGYDYIQGYLQALVMTSVDEDEMYFLFELKDAALEIELRRLV